MREPFVHDQWLWKGATNASPVQNRVRRHLAAVEVPKRVAPVAEDNRQVRDFLRSGVRMQSVLALPYPPPLTPLIVAYYPSCNGSSLRADGAARNARCAAARQRRETVTRLVNEGGIVAPTGKPGCVLMFHGNLVHASAPNITRPGAADDMVMGSDINLAGSAQRKQGLDSARPAFTCSRLRCGSFWRPPAASRGNRCSLLLQPKPILVACWVVPC